MTAGRRAGAGRRAPVMKIAASTAAQANAAAQIQLISAKLDRNYIEELTRATAFQIMQSALRCTLSTDHRRPRGWVGDRARTGVQLDWGWPGAVHEIAVLIRQEAVQL